MSATHTDDADASDCKVQLGAVAEAEAAIIEEIARAEHWDAHRDDEAQRNACPADMIPSEQDMIEFTGDGMPDSPPLAARTECEQLARAAMGFPEGLEAEFFIGGWEGHFALSLVGKDMAAFALGFTARGLQDRLQDGARHPFGPIIRAWQAARAPAVTPERRKDKRLLPVIPQQPRKSRPERLRGTLLAARSAEAAGGQLQLFDTPARNHVPLLSLLDASRRPVMAKGRGAPLPARLFVNTVLAVPAAERRRAVTPVEITVRELRDMNFPNGASQWRNRDWPALRAALEEAETYITPLPDGSPYGTDWRIIRLRNPLSGLEDRRGLPDLDGVVRLEVAFPPGSHAGPSVALPELENLSVTSAPRWRAYIAALSVAWKPGKTRRPAGKGAPFGWSRNREDYPVLSLEDRRLLAFGEGDTKHRTKSDIDAPWRGLPGLVTLERQTDPLTGETGFRMIPAEAACENDETGETR